MKSSPLHQRVEFTFPAPGDLTGLNPFDTRDICLRGVMTDPQGTRREVCGFADRDHRLDPVPGDPKAIERAIPTGPLVFRARVSACVAGRHDLKLWYESRGGRRVELEPISFEAVPGVHPGHVRLGKNGTSFATEDGNPFYPIGSNLCWPNMMGHFAGQKLDDLRQMIERLAGHGGTAFRLWANTPWAHAIDHTGKEEETLLKFGEINLAGCAKLDAIITWAEGYHLRTMFCIDSACNWASNNLSRSPYSKANGGPCESTADYFNLPEARAMTREKMKYVAARWGYSPAIWCWEFWNEIDGCGLQFVSPHQQLAWHQEMGRVLRQADPYRHLITTSTGHPLNFPAMWRIPEIEITQTHHYGYKDSVTHISDVLAGYHRDNTDLYRKPHIASELGVCFASDQSDWETDGSTLHNVLWSSAILPKTCGPGFLWFWDGYIHKHDLYPHYRGIANFLKEERWHELETLPLEISLGEGHSRELDPPGDLKVPTTLSGSDFYRSTFSIDSGGAPHGHLIPNTWYGSDRFGLQFRAVFQVDYPAAGQFIPMVWGGGNNTNGIVSVAGAPAGEPIAEIRLDGKVALRRPVVVTRPDGNKDLYCDRLAIDVPPGIHEIEMVNVGQGQFNTGHLLLTNYQTRSRRYSAQGLRCGDRCAFWIYNRDYQWETFKAGRAVEPIQDAGILFRDLTPGAYDLQWWDTLAGQVRQCERVRVGGDGALQVRVPVFVNDIAGKLIPGGS
jgi:hypothetical protein